MEWIKISERLPDGGTQGVIDVLCLITGLGCKVLTYVDGDNESEFNFYMDYRKHFDSYTPYVTHWMPLPPLPKED